MAKIINFSIEDKNDEGEKVIINFVAKKLPAVEQGFLILRIIGIIAKGAGDRVDSYVEQILHNLFQTGHQVDGVKNGIDTASAGGLVLNAVKGAVATLSNKDRDDLIATLIAGVEIAESAHFKTPVTIQELNQRLFSFQAFFKLILELIKVNLGFFSPKQG
jgi:hypothetical protein